MAYIGNTVENQGFTPAIDYFNGNGVTVTFTLSRPIASVAQVIVAIDNVIQNPSSSFTIAGNAITFSSAPLSGTNNIWVEYTSLITTYQAISQDPTVIGDIRATGGYLSEGDFGNSFVSGAILDYVTGLGRVTVGPSEGIALYNGGTASRTALMTVAATGNVGINTTNPLGKFEVHGQSRFASSASSAVLLIDAAATSTNGVDIQSSYYGGAGYGPMKFSTGGSERMRIDSSGQLLVNTTTALAQTTIYKAGSGLQVSSPQLTLQNAVVDGGTGDGPGINFANATGAVSNIGSSGDGAMFFSNRANTGAGWSERMRIDSSGTVLMGQTTNPATATLVLRVATGSANGVNAQITSNTGTSFPWSNYNATGSYVGGISCTSSATSFPTSSDFRLKKDIEDAPSAIDKVLNTKVVSHNWINDESHVEFGFIAQDLQNIIPQAVIKGTDKADGSMDMPWGVDYSKIVPLLVKSIQELKATVDAQAARIAALEAR
jgi:hypothetical protein